MTKSTRQKVKERAKYLCEYCSCAEYFSPDPFEIEHIIAVSKGGTDGMDNLALSCSGCNGYKGGTIQAIDPASGLTTALYNPRNESWEAHFCWNENFDTLIGISPIGRATISKLRLNRQSLINLRHVLRQVGEFPPF